MILSSSGEKRAWNAGRCKVASRCRSFICCSIASARPTAVRRGPGNWFAALTQLSDFGPLFGREAGETLQPAELELLLLFRQVVEPLQLPAGVVAPLLGGQLRDRTVPFLGTHAEQAGGHVAGIHQASPRLSEWVAWARRLWQRLWPPGGAAAERRCAPAGRCQSSPPPPAAECRRSASIRFMAVTSWARRCPAPFG